MCSASYAVFTKTLAALFLFPSFLLPPLFVDAENGTDGNVAVNVGGSVEGIKRDAVLPVVRLRDDDGILVLLTNKDGADSRVPECVDHNLVGHDVQHLLIVTCGVLLPSETVKFRYPGPLHGGGNLLAGESNGVHQYDQFWLLGVPHHEGSQGGSVLQRGRRGGWEGE